MIGVARKGSFWPTWTQERILQAIFCDHSRAREAWAEARATIDFDVMEPGSYFLLPSLYLRLGELGVADDEESRLKGIYRRTWYRNQLLLDAARGPLVALHERNVSVLVLGAAAASRYYAERGARWLEFVELAVPADRLTEARATLEEGGFGPAWEQRPAHRVRPTPFVDASSNILVLAGAPPVDLLDPADLAASNAALWRSTEDGELAGASIRALGPTEELLLICVVGATPAGAGKPIWVADAMSILGRAGASIDWERLVSRASEVRWPLRVRDALTYLAETLDAPVPPDALGLLERGTSRREALAHRLASRDDGALGGATRTLGQYVRLSSDRTALGAVVGYPQFLQQTWGLAHLRNVPLHALGKAARKLAAVFGSDPPDDQRQLSALSRGA